MIRFAIDRGGTFTDIYATCQGQEYRCKLLSEDPQNYVDAPSEGIRRLLQEIIGVAIERSEKLPIDKITSIRMGTTVATNALLEKKGSKVALVISKGFADILEIGYQERQDLFALAISKNKHCYQTVVEIDERVLHYQGKFEVITPLDRQEAKEKLSLLKQNGIEGLAVVFMHSYIYPEHEQALREIALEMGFRTISLSSEVMPQQKIVERGDTTVVDAYLHPKIQEYVSRFKNHFVDNLAGVELLFMQSNGGLTETEQFRGCNSILSGPAGGVVGYASVFQSKPLIGFDMGGTSTDVSRFSGDLEVSYENQISGVRIIRPQVDVLTVAAGGGSRLFYKFGIFQVGPESSGSHPGPVCYRKNGHLSVTDANLFLGRIQPHHFPSIFGPTGDLPLGKEEVDLAFSKLTEKINQDLQQKQLPTLSPEEVALGFLEVANTNMSKPILEVSLERGYDTKAHQLVAFGGAGPQHACSLARKLGIEEVFIHKDSGILSAYGMSQANIIREKSHFVSLPLRSAAPQEIQSIFFQLEEKAKKDTPSSIPSRLELQHFAEVKYENTENTFLLPYVDPELLLAAFEEKHLEYFGFLQQKQILIAQLKVKATFYIETVERKEISSIPSPSKAKEYCNVYFAGGCQKTPIYQMEELYASCQISGPAILLNQGTTILLEPLCTGKINAYGDLIITIVAEEKSAKAKVILDPIQLAVFHNLYTSIAVQMGKVLQKTSVSTNIKERLDFSCAVFSKQGSLIANAPHIPVHLGSMGFTVKKIIEKYPEIAMGDVFLTNSPLEGGSHLPDLTVVTPCFAQGELQFFVASRGHHADIGGNTPGSMPPFSHRIDEEGALFAGLRIVEAGSFQEDIVRGILTKAGARNISDNLTDLQAQMAANQKGISLLVDAMQNYDSKVLQEAAQKIKQVSEDAVRDFFTNLQAIEYHAKDFLDDGIAIDVRIRVDRNLGTAVFDFSHSGMLSFTNQNIPQAVTYSCIVYAIRCLVAQNLPLNDGFLQPIQVVFGENTLFTPGSTNAVVGGNVTTSQRVVDVILQAFSAAANSCGCMNNLIFGNADFGYYETIGGGSGAGEGFAGADGVHTHMTNTRITDPEVLEYRYPVLLHEFSLRRGSGGKGLFAGGDGLIREIEFLQSVTLSLLTERRVFSPIGLHGGGDASRGRNIYIAADGTHQFLPAKVQLAMDINTRIRLETPGGGAYGCARPSL
ncbi:MAG: hydantoinase B/oxoprolinase family protein [Spirochaetota bacterium]